MRTTTQPPPLPADSAETRRIRRIRPDPPVDLNKRGRYPIARRRPDGTIEIVPTK